MKTYVKIAFLAAAVMLILPAAAFAEEDAERPALKAGKCPMLRAVGRPKGPPHMPLLQCEEFKEEMKRHREAMAEIMEPVRKLRRELAESIRKLRQEYFPKPKEGEKRERPDPEKIKEFTQKVKELVKEFQDKNEETLKAVLGKSIDERITHHENIIKIAKDNKDKIVEARWRKLLLTPRLRHRLHRFFRRHRPEWRECRPGPEAPVEPAEE
ncbi:MAG: hypothetical protein DRP79_03580 [Planctomycetota bacterium]|nr:MAG: hypothetical protein DRP79_03580 [Planctomycetota bacterium]